MILCALSLKSLQCSKFCHPPDCAAVALRGKIDMVRAHFCEEHAYRGRFPPDIPRGQGSTLSTTTWNCSSQYSLRLPGPLGSERFLTRTLSPGSKVVPWALWSWNEFSLRAKERPFSASNGTRGTALHFLDKSGVTVLHWSWWTMSTSKRVARPNKRNNGE